VSGGGLLPQLGATAAVAVNVSLSEASARDRRLVGIRAREKNSQGGGGVSKNGASLGGPAGDLDLTSPLIFLGSGLNCGLPCGLSLELP
jgi:hypothetical protein